MSRPYRQDLAKLARELGWAVERTRGNHLRLRKPGCEPVITGFSPRDWRRVLKNVRAQLRRNERAQGGQEA